MANRSYIYALQPDSEPEYRDLGEWSTAIPLAHLLMVGFDARPVQSMLFDGHETIAVRGDAERGLAGLEAFLDWLQPQINDDRFTSEKERSLELLRREDRAGRYFHLEPVEIYDLMCLTLPEMQDETERVASRAQALAQAASRAVEVDQSLDESAFAELEGAWKQELGLYFSDVLYFHAG